MSPFAVFAFSQWTGRVTKIIIVSFHKVNWAGAKALMPFVQQSLLPPGFYTLVPKNSGPSALGPFCGRPPCQLTAFGQQIRSTAAAEKRIVIVYRVRKFPSNIAYDAERA